MDVILLSLLVDASHEQDPALDTSLWTGLPLICLVDSFILSLLAKSELNSLTHFS